MVHMVVVVGIVMERNSKQSEKQRLLIKHRKDINLNWKRVKQTR